MARLALRDRPGGFPQGASLVLPVSYHAEAMHVDLDLQQMRNCMDLWRHELSIRNQGHGDAARAKMLANLRGTIAGWLDLMRLCTADDSDEKMLIQIIVEVRDFLGWVDEAQFAHALMKPSKRP